MLRTLHQQCDLHLRDRFNRCNHNQFDRRPNRKRQPRVRRHNNRRDQHSRHRRERRVPDQAHLVRDRYRHRQVRHDQYRHRRLRADQKVA